MRIIFMGSAEFSIPSLRALARGSDDIACVVTQPDRPKGRGRVAAPCPAAQFARGLGLEVFAPERAGSEESLRILGALKPDLIIVVAYGQILKRDLLAMPPLGCVNVHASLLPKYRGAAPIHWAIVNGETVTGVTTMFMNEKMDQGDIILQEETAVLSEDTAGTMHDKLAGLGANVLMETVDLLRRGKAPRRPQEHELSTYAPKLSGKDGRIDWTATAREIHNRVRGFNPWPGCRCEVGAGRRRWKIKVLKVEPSDLRGEPGTIAGIDGAGPVAACGDASVRIVELQPENGNRMSGTAYLAGHPMAIGDRIE